MARAGLVQGFDDGVAVVGMDVVEGVGDPGADEGIDLGSEERGHRPIRVDDPGSAHDGDSLERSLHEVLIVGLRPGEIRDVVQMDHDALDGGIVEPVRDRDLESRR